MGDSNVAQALGRHWYEEHSHRYAGDFILVRKALTEIIEFLIIGRRASLWRLMENTDQVAREWALSMIEVCEHEDGTR